jgi:polysaccharide pyruvyl transferase WcaK-like protein
MRLHSSLTVLRFGNPAVNISYSPKGVNVFRTLGLEDNAFEISKAMQNPTNIWLKVESILDNLTDARKKVARGVDTIMQTNMNVFRSLFSGDDE